MNQRSKWSYDLICLAIFLVSFIIRLTKMIFDPLLVRDAVTYLREAELWNETGDYLAIVKEFTAVPPLPLWCVKTLMPFCGSSEIAGRSLSVFLGGLIPVIGFILAREITHNIRFSLIAALCLILHPNLVDYSIQPLRENYYILMISLLLIAMYRNYRNTRTMGWIICGAIIGIASFCRYESTEFLIFVAAEAAVLKLKKDRIASFLKTVCVVFLAFILTSLSLLAFTDADFSFINRIKTLYSSVLTK